MSIKKTSKKQVNSKTSISGKLTQLIKQYEGKTISSQIERNLQSTNVAIFDMAKTPVLDLFDEIYTDRDFDLSKKNPQIYVKTCEKMGESPSDTVVFEDALYAVESAKKAQCTVIGVYDEYSKCDWQNIKNIANSTIDWR